MIYPKAEGLKPSNQYFAKVNNQEIFVYQTSRIFDYMGSAQVDTASFINFETTKGKTDIEIIPLTVKEVKSIIIRPLTLNIQPTIEEGSIRFSINGPVKLSVEINGTPEHKMLVFANAPEQDIPDKNAPDVYVVHDGECIKNDGDIPENTRIIYFEPGIHDVGKGYVNLYSNQSIYLPGGAYLKGRIRSVDSKNVKVYGNGIISGENYVYVHNKGYEDYENHLHFGGCQVETDQEVTVIGGCQGVTVQDVTVINSAGFMAGIYQQLNWAVHEVEPSLFKDVKLIGFGPNNSGINPRGSNITIDGCFILASDDCICLDDSVNLTIKNCVIWSWHNGAVFCLSWNASYEFNTFVDNIDIIHFDRNWNNYNDRIFFAAHGYDGDIHNLLFQNIRVETMDGEHGLLHDTLSHPSNQGKGTFIGLDMYKNPWGNPNKSFGSIRNIYIKNLTINSTTFGNYIWGHSEKNDCSNFTFENLVIDEKTIVNPVDADLHANDFAKDIKCIAKNHIDEWSFEDYKPGESSWKQIGNQSAFLITKKGEGFLGSFAGMHLCETDYQLITNQTVQKLENGTYSLDAWVKSSGGQNKVGLSVSGFGSDAIGVDFQASEDWIHIHFSEINITNGQCQVSFISDANGGQWIMFDNVQLYRQVEAIGTTACAFGIVDIKSWK